MNSFWKRFTSMLVVVGLVLGAAASAYPVNAQVFEPVAPEANAKVKVAHLAPFANTPEGTSVTVRVNGADALTDFVFSDITGELDFAPGDYDIEILPTGTSTVAISGTVTVEADTSYTLAAIGNGAQQPLELFAMVDDTMAPSSGAKLRIAHLAPFAADLEATKVDICTDEGAVAAGLTNIPYKGFTDPYLQLPAGDYDLMIAAPGGTCDTMLLDLPSVRLEAGMIYDVFAIGDLENQPLQITSTTGLDLTPARVKVAHFASFADIIGGTSVTVRVNGADALEEFTFGEITDYLELPAGEELQIQILPTGSSTAAISGTLTLEAAMEYTLAAIGDGTNQPLELFPLVDDNEPAEAVARVRIVHLAPFAADLEDTKVDICTQDGTVVPGLTGIPYKAATDPYVQLPAGLYDLKVTAAGSDCATTLIDLPALRLFNGQVASVFAAGDGENLAPTAFIEAYTMPNLIFAPAILRNSSEN